MPFRVGVDAVVGLVPGAGDLLLGAAGLYALYVAHRLHAPPAVLARMLANLGIDTLVGTVPLVGDLFDAGWKANTRNRRLLEEWVATPSRTARRSGAMFAAAGVLLLLALAASLWLAWAVVGAVAGWLRGG